MAGADAERFAEWWLELGAKDVGAGPLHFCLLRRLQLAGFTGHGDCVETRGGYAFAQHPLEAGTELMVAVAMGVRMLQGAPALLLKPHPRGIHGFVDVALFIGRVPEGGVSVRVL